MCDNYKVGPRWHITVDGIVMSREQTTLARWNSRCAIIILLSALGGDFPTAGNGGIGYAGGTANGAGVDVTPQDENFHYGPGGRITFTSQVGRCTGYDVEAAYEGINNWNSSVVFPKEGFLRHRS